MGMGNSRAWDLMLQYIAHDLCNQTLLLVTCTEFSCPVYVDIQAEPRHLHER